MLHHGRSVVVPPPRPSPHLTQSTPLAPHPYNALRFTSSLCLLHKTADLYARRHREMLMDSFVENPSTYLQASSITSTPLWKSRKKKKKKKKKETMQKEEKKKMNRNEKKEKRTKKNGQS